MKLYLLLFSSLAGCIIVNILWYCNFSDDNYDIPWVQIDASGKTIKGLRKYIGEGNGYEGEPDEQPSVVLNKYKDEISTHYTGIDKTTLSISYNNPPTTQSIDYIGNNKKWHSYKNGIFLSITITNGDTTNRTVYDSENKLEYKNIYYNKNPNTPWSGLNSYLSKTHQWCFEKHKNGKLIINECNLSIDDVNVMYRQNSEKITFNYEMYVYEQCRILQQQVSKGINVPALCDETYESLMDTYFSLTKN
jgi:hypothetical protein